MRIIAVVMFGWGLLASFLAWGDSPGMDKKPGGGPGLEPLAQELLGENWEQRDVHELVELVMMVRLSQELDLSEERTVAMVRRFQELKGRQKELGERRQKAAKELKEAVKIQESDEVVQGKLDALMALDSELVTMRQKAFEEVSAELTTMQRAKLYVFLQEFEGQMRRLIEKARQRRGMDREARPGASEGAPGRQGRDEGQRSVDKVQKREESGKDEAASGMAPPEAPQEEQKEDNPSEPAR